MLIYKLYINVILETIKVDIKKAQTRNKNSRKIIPITGIIFLFINVKRFKKSFSAVSFYIKLYTK